MGKSYTLRYQIGRLYTIKHIAYFVKFQTNSKKSKELKKYKNQYDDVIIRSDRGTYNVMIPVMPDMTNPRFRYYLKKYHKNHRKLFP